MMQKNALQNNAESSKILPELLTYFDIAKALGVPKGTLDFKLHAYNKAAPAKGWAVIRPDAEQGEFHQHLYRRERLPEFKAMLQVKLADRKPGRPRKNPQ